MPDNTHRKDWLPNMHPGEMLRIDFLEPMGITPYKLAKDLGLAQSHVAELVKGERNITALTAALLGAYFDMTPQFWINLQTHYDLMEVQRNNADRVKRVVPFQQEAKAAA